MMQWQHHLNLHSILDKYDEDESNFTEVRDEAVQLLTESGLFSGHQRLIDNLAKAESSNDFDAALSDIYDFADKGKYIWLGM